jgi:hypothetical protein
VDAVLAELAVAQRDGGTCLGRDLQHPGHQCRICTYVYQANTNG